MVGLALVGMTELSQAAWARTAPHDCEADSACLALYERAKAQSVQGNLLEAVRLYKLAFEIQADPRILYNIARLLHKQGDHEAAANFYQRFLDSPLDDEEQKQKARGYLAQISPAKTTTGSTVADDQPAQTEKIEVAPKLAPRVEAQVPSDVGSSPVPVYKKWWFWTAVGGGAALLVTGIAVGVGVGGRATTSTDPVPAGTFMYRPTF